MSPVRVLNVLVALLLVLGACGSGGTEPGSDDAPETSTKEAEEGAADQKYPDVTDVTVEQTGDTYSFSVTISSPYDTPERYADGWRVMGTDGTVYGEHTLMHDHAGEQPFTRTQTGVEIPDDVDEVVVEGRDSEHGYGGGTTKVVLP